MSTNKEFLTESENPYLNVKAAQIKQMLVPFSSQSFLNSSYSNFLFYSGMDLVCISINILSLCLFIIEDENRYVPLFLYLQLLSPFIVAFGALDLSLNLAIFTLGLFTRSLASIYYMINYEPVDAQLENIGLEHEFRT